MSEGAPTGIREEIGDGYVATLIDRKVARDLEQEILQILNRGQEMKQITEKGFLLRKYNREIIARY